MLQQSQENAIHDASIASISGASEAVRKPALSYMASTASQRQRQRLRQPLSDISNKRNPHSLPTSSTNKRTKQALEDSDDDMQNPTGKQQGFRKHKKARKPKKKLHLPDDIIHNIALFSDKPTILNLLRVSPAFYEIVGPRLYQSIEITSKNAELLFVGLPRSVSYRKYKVPEALSLPQIRTKTITDPLDKPIELRWPDVPLDSEDEYSPSKESLVKSILPPETKVYRSTVRTEVRKVKLFKHTTALKIDCRIPTHLSRDLLGWINTQSRSPQPLFPNVTKIIITEKAVRDWADRQDRICPVYKGTRNMDSIETRNEDPFTTLLRNIAKPRNICITLPRYDNDKIEEYIRGRTVDVYHGRLVNLSSRLMEKWTSRAKKMVKIICPDILDHLKYEIGTASLENYVIHNWTTGSFGLRNNPSKIFFSPYIGGPDAQKVSAATRFDQLNKLASCALLLNTLDLRSLLFREKYDRKQGKTRLLFPKHGFNKDYCWETIVKQQHSIDCHHYPETEDLEKVISAYELVELDKDDSNEENRCECCGGGIFEYWK